MLVCLTNIDISKCKRIGTMAWLALAITGTEILIWVKFSKGQFDHVVVSDDSFALLGNLSASINNDTL